MVGSRRLRVPVALAMTIGLFASVVGGYRLALADDPDDPGHTTSIDCNSAYGSQFAGWANLEAEPSGWPYEGTSSQISINSGPICDTGGHDQSNFNYVWAMIAENLSTGANRGYAQVGYMRWWGSCRYFTAEYRRGPEEFFHRTIDLDHGCLPNGTTRFRVRYQASTGFEQMLEASQVISSTPWSIFLEWASPYSNEFSGETKYVGSNIPGVASDKTSFSTMQVQLFEGDSWTDNLPNNFLRICPFPERYLRSGINNNGFNLWTGSGSGDHCA